MNKTIEKATLKLVQEMEKNRKAYDDAVGSYRDTGYNRYYNKMEKLEKEYEEMKAFLGLDKHEERERIEAENTRLYAENKELKRFIKEAKSCMDYIHANYWSDPDVKKLYERFKDFI